MELELERLKTTCEALNHQLCAMEALKSEVPRLQKRLSEAQEGRATAEEEIELLKKDNCLLEEKNKLLVKKCDRLQEELNTVNKDYELSESERLSMAVKFDEGSKYVLSMEEKVYKSNKISLELLKQLKDAELEIDCLKQYIVDLKSRVGLYIPIRDDDIDMRLADYINNHPAPAKLKVLFIREGAGIYNFGSRRVNLKLEQYGKIKVRIGGGWLSIDEFLDTYTKQEYEKAKAPSRDHSGGAKRSASPTQRRS